MAYILLSGHVYVNLCSKIVLIFSSQGHVLNYVRRCFFWCKLSMPLILMPNDLCLLVFECFPGLSSNPSAMPLYLMKCDMYIWSILGGCRLLLKLIMHTRVTPHWGEQPGHTVLSNVPPPQFMSLMTPILSETMQIFYPTYFSLSYTLCNHSQDGEQDERIYSW